MNPDCLVRLQKIGKDASKYFLTSDKKHIDVIHRILKTSNTMHSIDIGTHVCSCHPTHSKTGLYYYVTHNG